MMVQGNRAVLLHQAMAVTFRLVPGVGFLLGECSQKITVGRVENCLYAFLHMQAPSHQRLRCRAAAIRFLRFNGWDTTYVRIKHEDGGIARINRWPRVPQSGQRSTFSGCQDTQRLLEMGLQTSVGKARQTFQATALIPSHLLPTSSDRFRK